MKVLELKKMEEIEAGSCAVALAGLGFSWASAGLAFGTVLATTTPVGWAAMAGIYLAIGSSLVSGVSVVHEC